MMKPFTAIVFVLVWATAHAATITVTSTNDSGAGSLRAALAAVANGDVINATAVTGSITLATGQLLVSNSVTILGPGPANLAVNGNFPNASNHVFHVINAVTAVISGITMTNGNAVFFPAAGLWNDLSTLTLSNCTITGNLGGGGIYNTGTLSIHASSVTGNTTGGIGAGIFNDGSSGNVTLFITASTISSNSAVGNNTVGGGIFNTGNSLGPATLVLSNCTFSGNSAVGTGTFGGAIYHTAVSGSSSTATVIACTFHSNTAESAGGIFVQGNATAVIGDTVFKAGSAGSSIGRSSGEIIKTLGYNISSDNGGGFLTNATDQINTDPLLGPLASNGGPTLTHAPKPGSPAIDRGKSFGLTTDQRGLARPVDDPCFANVAGGDGSDIGAVEAQDTCVFKITSLVRETNNIRIAWTTYAGTTNAVERTAGAAGSFATNNFAGITNIITTGTTTNYLDIGAATNLPAFYYRVRLVP